MMEPSEAALMTSIGINWEQNGITLSVAPTLLYCSNTSAMS